MKQKRPSNKLEFLEIKTIGSHWINKVAFLEMKMGPEITDLIGSLKDIFEETLWVKQPKRWKSWEITRKLENKF